MIYLKPELMQPLREAAVRNDPIQMQSAIQKSLQNAIALEFATIPTYLYAMWSLDETNEMISDLINDIVVDEMFHMAIASNILVAVGGSPQIVGAVPTYPTHLPGSIESGVIVPLSPFSTDLVKNVFMMIEEPENPIDFPTNALTMSTTTLTIGMFYNAISNLIGQAGQSIFTGGSDKQLVKGDAKLITDVASAQAGIETIVTQGEGTTMSPVADQGQLAHFYKFEEILKGKTLNLSTSPPGFGTPDITFNSSGVLPVISNPRESSYAEGSDAQKANAKFNEKFTQLVNGLQATFNVKSQTFNDEHLVRVMQDLTTLANNVMTTPIGNGQNAGPTFDFQGFQV
jgi:rubrerythrin